MTTERDSTSAARADAPATAGTPGAGTLALFALAWLLAMLASARYTIAGSPDHLVVTHAALALPAVVSATLLAGSATGLAAASWLAGRRPVATLRSRVRFGAGALVGLVTGLAVATLIALGYSTLPSIPVLCGAVAAAATLGGLLAGVHHRLVLAAGVTGALGVFVVGFVSAVFDGALLNLFGAGESELSRLTANRWVALAASLVAGLAAGGIGYTYLRRSGPPLRWPAYLVAGALPGLLVLAAEAITRLGGARLFRLVSEVGAGDQAYLHYLDAARVNRALVVLFVGALVAIVLVGRTLRPGDPGHPSGTHQPDDAAGPGKAAGSGDSAQASSS